MGSSMVSVIVPAYNAERWISQCITSILGQTYSNLEILLIDDGSGDRTAEICDRYAEKDSRIRVFHRPNGGVSSARNMGIRESRGEYLVFVDADDFLDDPVIERSVALLETDREKRILCQWNTTLVQEGHENLIPEDLHIDSMDQEEFYRTLISGYQGNYNLGGHIRAVWGKMLYGDIIREQGMRFDEALYLGEDAIFLMQYLGYVDSCELMNGSGYNYRYQTESAVHRYKKDLLQQSTIQLERMESLLMEKKIDSNPHVRLGIITFQWEILMKLFINSTKGIRIGLLEESEKYRDAEDWYRQHKVQMRYLNPLTCGLSKTIRIQAILDRILPCRMQLRICYRLMNKNRREIL